MNCIMPCFCLPPLNVWFYILKADKLLIETSEHYQKRSFRNKFFSLSAQGVQSFSIPLRKGKHQQKSIREIEIAYDEDWVTRLERHVRTNYGSAPYFSYYFDSFIKIAQSRYIYLFELNLAWLNYINSALKLDITIEFTSDYISVYPEADIDIRVLSTSQTNLSKYQGIVYEQVHSDRQGFTPNLSIVDALFCLGPQTKTLLRDLSAKTVHLSSDIDHR